MILETEIQEIRTMLKEAKNPLFIFDDDQDGLCSFLLLWKWQQRGKGIPIKGKISEDIIHKIEREKADLILLLDKPTLEQEFISAVQIPIIHIDHHPLLLLEAPNYHYFNPRKENLKDDRPTSYWAYQVTKQNLWIAMVGIVGDWFLPEFIPEFQKEYPDLIPEAHSPGQIFFDTEFGKLIRSFVFSLKGKPQEKSQCIKILTRVEHPNEILKQETARGKFIWKHYLNLEKKYQKIIKEGLAIKTRGKILFFNSPPDQDSFTSLVSNELSYRRPNKIIIVGRIKNERMIMSLRSNNLILPPIIHKCLDGLTGTGGGHDHACGATVRTDEFGIFMTRFKKLTSKAK